MVSSEPKMIKEYWYKSDLLTPCKHSVSLQVPLETFSSQLHRQLPVFGFHCFGDCLNSELYRIHVLLLEPHTCVFSTQAISGTLTAALPSKLVRWGHEFIIEYYFEVKDAANFLSIRESFYRSSPIVFFAFQTLCDQHEPDNTRGLIRGGVHQC